MRVVLLKIVEIILLISLYWFAVQQQISTFRRQRYGLFNSTFSAGINNCHPGLQKHLKGFENLNQILFKNGVYVFYVSKRLYERVKSQ